MEPLPPLLMQPHGLPGALITADGNDGSGKTSTLDTVAEYLLGRGIARRRIATPSPQCRDLDLFRRYSEDPTRVLRGEIHLASLCLICLGDRLSVLHRQILPLLQEGVWVLCDRYVYTALAELLATGCDRRDLAAVLAVAARFPLPDLALVTAVAPEKAIHRIRQRPAERNRSVDRELFGRFNDAFLSVAGGQGLTVVPTYGGRETVVEHLRPVLDDLIHARARSSPSRRAGRGAT